MAGMFDYESQRSDLLRKYMQDNAAQEFGRTMGQQRYARQRDDMQRGFKRAIPGFQSQWANRGLRHSGIRAEGTNRFVGDYQRMLSRAAEDQGNVEAGYAMQQANRDADYQAALLRLYEQLQQQRLQADPWASLQGVS